MENKEKIVSRDDLMAKIWESDDYIDENTLSVNVNRLRKKLKEIGLDDFIMTKKGLGYKLVQYYEDICIIYKDKCIMGCFLCSPYIISNGIYAAFRNETK